MVGFFIFFSKPFRIHKMVIYNVRLDRAENLKLFYYLAYFFYNLWILLYFLVLFMDFIILFQLTFTFIYNTFNNNFSVLLK